jgi:uncharacterized protein YggE
MHLTLKIMKTKALLTAFILLSLIVNAQLIENIPLVTTTGEATVKVKPDFAVLSVRTKRTSNIANIIATTDAFLFSKQNADIRFIDVDNKEVLITEPELVLSNNTVTFIREFIITVHKMEDVPKVILDLLRHDFTDIYAVSFRSSKLEEAKAKARKLAITNAQRSAQTFAEAIGKAIGKAHIIKEEDPLINNWYIEKYNPNLKEIVNTEYQYNPGLITIPCRVTASFMLIK